MTPMGVDPVAGLRGGGQAGHLRGLLVGRRVARGVPRRIDQAARSTRQPHSTARADRAAPGRRRGRVAAHQDPLPALRPRQRRSLRAAAGVRGVARLGLGTGAWTCSAAVDDDHRAGREPPAIARDLPAGVVEQGLDAVRRTPAGPRLDAWLARWGLGTIDLDPGSRSSPSARTWCWRCSPRTGPSSRSATSRAGARRRSRPLGRRSPILQTAPASTGPWRSRARVPAARGQRPVHGGHAERAVRRVLREVGGRLAARGALERAGDVAYLEVGELADALAGGETAETPRQRVRRRRAEAAWVLAHPAPRSTDRRQWTARCAGDPACRAPRPRSRAVGAGRRDGSGRAAVGHGGRWHHRCRRLTGALHGAGAPGRDRGRPCARAAGRRAREPHDPSRAIVFGRLGALVTDGGGLLRTRRSSPASTASPQSSRPATRPRA